MDSEEIRFPIDPNKQLVLSKRARSPTVRITPVRAGECNQDSAYACHNFVISNPRSPAQVEVVKLPTNRPVLRFNTGPLVQEHPDGTKFTSGEVMHLWVPRS